jgi:hypothetical protein
MLRGDNSLSYTFSEFIKESELILNARYGRRDVNNPKTESYTDQITVFRIPFTNSDYRLIYTDVYDAVKDMYDNDYGGSGSIKHISIKVTVNSSNDYDLDILLIVNAAPLPTPPNANCGSNFDTTDDWDWIIGSCDDQIATSGAADQLDVDLNRYFDANPGTIVIPQSGSTIIGYNESSTGDLHATSYPNANDVTPMDNERDYRFYYNVNIYPNYSEHACIEYDDLNFYFCEMIDIAVDENPNSFQYFVMDVKVSPDAAIGPGLTSLQHFYEITYPKPVYHVFHGLLISDGPIYVSTDNTTIY